MNQSRFTYTALDAHGAKVRGEIWHDTTAAAYAALQQQGLAPVRIGQGVHVYGSNGPLSARALAEFLHDVGALVAAGATLTSALAMYRQEGRASRKLNRFAEAIEREIASGRSVSESFRMALSGQALYVPALISGGEASGSLAGALQGAGQQIEFDERLKSEFWTSVSYPLFILASSLMAILLLLFVVIPSIAPLIEEAGADAPLVLRVMIDVSGFLVGAWPLLSVGAALTGIVAVVAWRAGLLRSLSDRLLLDGPGSAISRRLIFGRFASVFGRLLTSGVATHEAFGLASAALTVRLAQERVRSCSTAIFDGARVSQALAGCRGLPGGIVRMAAVGEEAGSLGPMIERAAKIELETATRALGSLTKWLGPVMIVTLGVMIGLIMGGLLTGVSGIGESVLAGS